MECSPRCCTHTLLELLWLSAMVLSAGIDIAYLLSGAAYHTQTDTLDAIRPGVLQETGQSMTAGIRSLAAALSAAAAASDAAGTGTTGSKQPQQPTLQELLEPTDHKRMFVSIASSVMITYSSNAARLLHNIPLILALTAPHTMQLLTPSTVSARSWAHLELQSCCMVATAWSVFLLTCTTPQEE